MKVVRCQQRAEAVRYYLIQQGVAPSALIAKGYGDTRPSASNDTEEGKFRNRRIEFTVR
jgi:OmpA-OmpF porin, OOP family